MEACQYCQIYHTFTKEGIQGLGIMITYKLNWSINWICNAEMHFNVQGWTAGWFRWSLSSYCLLPSNAQAQQWKPGGGTGKGRLVICTNWVQPLPPPIVSTIGIIACWAPHQCVEWQLTINCTICITNGQWNRSGRPDDCRTNVCSLVPEKAADAISEVLNSKISLCFVCKIGY